MTGTEIEQLIELAKRHGLQSLTVPDLHLTFFPYSTAPAQTMTVTSDLLDRFAPKNCRCGHSPFDHNASVGCTRGCDLATCTFQEAPESQT